MRLSEVYANAKPIVEGGSMPGVGSIHISEIEPTLKPLERALGVELIKNTLGSVGKRQFSGDIDVALNVQGADLAEFIEKLKATPDILDIAKSSVIMTKVRIENFDPDKQDPQGRPRTGYVQVDFMPGDPEWLKTYYHSPTEQQSKYKGVYRNIMMATMAALLDREDSPEQTPDGRPLVSQRYMWSPTDGLVRIQREPVPKKSGDGYTKQNHNVIIGGPWKKPAEIARELKLDGPDDLNSYESLKRAMEKNYPSELVNKIITSFAENSQVRDLGVPGDIINA